MRRDLRDFLRDVLDHIGRIEGFLAGKDLATFSDDLECKQAVYWSLFTICEAMTVIARLDPEAAATITDIRDIRILRNLLAHSYFAVNDDYVWDTCRTDLGPLRARCKLCWTHSNAAAHC